jgi:hypothetical protein
MLSSLLSPFVIRLSHAGRRRVHKVIIAAATAHALHRMDPMLPKAHVVHRTSERLRIKIPPRRHQPRYFARVQRCLRGKLGILSVDVNPTTASVLIRHDGSVKGTDLRDPLLGFQVDPADAASQRQVDIPSTFKELDEGVRTVFGTDTGLASLVSRSGER